MDSLITSLWLQTALCLAGWIVGLVLHLKWHPLRQHLSDAWDLMAGMPWLIVMQAALYLLAEWQHPGLQEPHWSMNELSLWRDLSWPLALRSTEAYVQSLHALFQPWPLALIVPPVLTSLAWKIHHQPRRYAAKKQSLAETIMVWASVLFAWAWITLEIVHLFRPLAAWLQTLLMTGRMVFSALAMAISQILVIRLLMGWEEPTDPNEEGDAQKAVEHTLARWRSVYALAALDLLWLIWAQHQDGPGGNVSRWLLVEAMIVFAPLPVAMAYASGPILEQGAQAMRTLLHSWLPWLGLTITAVTTLMFIDYTSAVLLELAGKGTLMAKAFLPVHALVLATVRSWLFLATVFTFIRHGLKPASASRSAD